MRPLIIDDALKINIMKMISIAKENIIPNSFLMENAVDISDTDRLDLKDRPKDFKPYREVQKLSIPFGYDVAFSIEDQKAGLTGHLSVSLDRAGVYPSPESVEEISALYGLPKASWQAIWLEEFQPSHYAVNILAPFAE